MTPPHPSLQAAAEWYATLLADDASTADRAGWQAWLAQSPGNRQAWDEIEAIARQFQPLQQTPAQRQAASSALQAAHRVGQAASPRRKALRSLAWLAASGLSGWLAWRHTPLRDGIAAQLADFHTRVGETRALQLADGTQVWLNTASALDVCYSATQRALRLVTGEVLIETAADPARAFMLHTPHGQMQALGTRFGVRLREDSTELAVYEGAVRIHTGATHTTVTLQAGQQTQFDCLTIGATRTAPAEAPAWPLGMLVAHDMPLAQLATELARYRHGHISVAPEVAGLRVLGTYPLGDSELALQLLAKSLPIRIRRTLPWWVSITAL
ncbi:MAG: FecR domain-containing protein [Comamonas sp.]